MKTAFPRKYILNIVPEDEDVSSGYSIISDGIHLDNLLEDLNNVNIALPEGELQRLKNIGNFAVFVFMFDGVTLCSTASNKDFAGVRFPVSEFSLPQEGIDRNVAWSFFTLKPELDYTDFVDSDRKVVVKSFVYPIPKNENMRMQRLQAAIVKHYNGEYDIEKVDTPRETDHFCQFSGGGDLCIYDLQKPLVVQGSIAEQDDEELDCKLSPVRKGTCKSTLSIEGKKDGCDHDKLQHQLWANMVITSVTKFINRIPSFSEENILAVENFTGYGIAYTGCGDFGFFKLEMEFGKQTQIIAKFKIA